jgi:hypothetical protein
MTKGYLIFAQNNKTDDYIRMAYALALSIKVSQDEVTDVCLVTDIPDSIPQHYTYAFNKIITVPWNDDAWFSTWKIENRWKLYSISPYDETVILDADMLFLSNIDNWWNYLSKAHDGCFVTKSMTYRGEVADDSYYRKTFIDNDLPNVYSAFFYFKKTDRLSDYWNTVKIITLNWKTFFKKFLSLNAPTRLSMDVVFALAAKIHGLGDDITSSFDYPTITHMKAYAQGWRSTENDWMSRVGSYMNSRGILKIGNHQQSGIFHYTEKEFLTDHIVTVYENLYKEKFNV